MMAALMKKMSSSSSNSNSDYDYDYGYGYDYGYSGMGASSEYDYDYAYDYSSSDSSPSPLSSILQQMLQQKLSKTEPLQLTLNPVEIAQADSSETSSPAAPEADQSKDQTSSANADEIAPPPRPTKSGSQRIEEISYRSVP